MLPISVSRGSIWRFNSLILKSSTNLNFSSWHREEGRALIHRCRDRGGLQYTDVVMNEIIRCIIDIDVLVVKTRLLVFFLELVDLLLFFSDGIISICDLSFVSRDLSFQPFNLLLEVLLLLVQSPYLLLRSRVGTINSYSSSKMRGCKHAHLFDKR